MKRYTLLLAVLHYFKSHNDSQECFVTEDGQIFHDKNNAITHGRDTLASKLMPEHFERVNLSKYEEEAEKVKGEGEGEGEALKPNVSLPEDYSTWKKPALEAELTKRGIKFELMATNAVKAQLLANDDAEKAKA